MSVVIRPGPGTSESARDLDQNYRVMITVTPPNLLPIPVNSLSVAPRPVVTLPRLTIRLDVGEWEASVYPKQNWSSRGLTWIPTARHQSAILWLTSARGELMSPILLFHVVGSDIALEFADAPSKLVSASTLDEVVSLYLEKPNATAETTRKLYRLPSDFPAAVTRDRQTLRVEARRRVLLDDEGHQMLVTLDYASLYSTGSGGFLWYHRG